MTSEANLTKLTGLTTDQIRPMELSVNQALSSIRQAISELQSTAAANSVMYLRKSEFERYVGGMGDNFHSEGTNSTFHVKSGVVDTTLSVQGLHVTGQTTLDSGLTLPNVITAGYGQIAGTLTAGNTTLGNLTCGVLSPSSFTPSSFSTTGTLQAGACTLASAAVTGTLSAAATTLTSAVVTGSLSAGQTTLGATTLASAAVTGTLTAAATTLASAVVTGSLSAGSTTLGATTLNSARVIGTLSAAATSLASAVIGGSLSAGATSLTSAVIGGSLSAGATTLGALTVTSLNISGAVDLSGQNNINNVIKYFEVSADCDLNTIDGGSNPHCVIAVVHNTSGSTIGVGGGMYSMQENRLSAGSHGVYLRYRMNYWFLSYTY